MCVTTGIAHVDSNRFQELTNTNSNYIAGFFEKELQVNRTVVAKRELLQMSQLIQGFHQKFKFQYNLATPEGKLKAKEFGGLLLLTCTIDSGRIHAQILSYLPLMQQREICAVGGLFNIVLQDGKLILSNVY